MAGSNVLATLTGARGGTTATVALFVLAGAVWLVLDYLLPYLLVLARRTEQGVWAWTPSPEWTWAASTGCR